MTGELVCRSTPSGATVFYNGTKLTNPTPVRLINLSPGLKTIGYSLPGYHSYSDRVEVFDDTTSYSNVTLKAIDEPTPTIEPGQIRCVTTPPGADIYFNGRKQVNITPVTLTGITPNIPHTIKFVKSGFKDISDQWTVAPGKTVVAEKILTPTVSDTILTLNTLQKTVTEGDELTLSGKLLTTDGRPVVGKISLMDVFFVDELLTTTTTSSTGAFLVTWIVKKVNSPPYASRIDIAAKYTGIDPYKSSESAKQTLVIETKVEKGFIDVSSQPPNADVFMDGKKMLGETPMHLTPDEIGKHSIKIVFGEFEPYEEVVEVEAGKTADVRHTFIAPSNFCSILGFDVTAEECSRALFALPIDLLTPVGDAHIIINHTSPYTGNPEEPTNLTYAFFLLGLIPFAGTVPKIVSKAGFKVTAKGAQLVKLAKADPRIASIFMEENIIGKILSMTATEVDNFINLVMRKNYDGIRAMLKDTKAEALPTDKIDEIITNTKTIIPDEDALKRIEDILTIEKVIPDKFMFWTDWLTLILKADKTSVSHDEAAKILKDAMEDPSLFRKIADELDLSGITARLEAIDSNESFGVYSLIRWISKIDTRLPIEQQNKLVSEMAETALATLEKTPKFIKELPKALDEIDDISRQIYPFSDAITKAGLKDPFNIVNEIEIFLKAIRTTPFTSRPVATAAFIKKLMKASWEFLRANPKDALKLFVTTALGVTVMSLWFNSDNVPFYGYMWLEHKGLNPGTRSFIANQQLDGLKTQAFLSKDFCEMADYENLRTSLDLYKTKLNTLETYINENRETLESEGFLDLAEDGLESYTQMLETDEMLKCLPPEITIPESGLITDVTVKEIIDGDTIKCQIADQPEFKVRMAGYNTPEKKPAILDFYPVTCTESVGSTPHTIECSKETYQEANGFFWKLIESKTVSLKINPERPKDAYGRYIAVVILENGSEANLEMIKAGHACFYHEEYFGEPKIYDPSTYIAARDEAKAARLGIWASAELESDVGSVIFKAFRLTEEDKPIGLTAEIWLGDDFLYNSSTTKERDWPVGTNEVVFKAMGYVDHPIEFTVEKNKPIVVDATLTSTAAITDEGYAIFRTYRKSSTGLLTPIISDVYENNVYLFRTSSSVSRAMPPGEHTVTFKHVNYEDISTTFTIKTDEPITIDETLIELPGDETEDPADPDEPFGLVDFMSTPSVAKIFVNGSYIGTTKKSGFKLVEGSYSVSFEKKGYLPCTKPLTVTAVDNERVPVECILTESLLPPIEPDYPDVPYFPSTPSYQRSPPISYEIQPTITAPPVTAPKAEPWEEFKEPMKVLFLNIGKEVTKQTTITTAGQKFMDKHCDLKFEWESEDHDTVELGIDDDDCATLDDIEELSETIEQDTIPDGTKIIYLLWNADEPKCVSYTGYTGDTVDLLFDAMLCSSPTSKSKPEFTATTGKLKNDNLDITYEGSLTIITQICEALHELYEKTKSDDAEELPDFDEEFCEKNITEGRPNAKCVVEWLSKFNDALPDEVKK